MYVKPTLELLRLFSWYPSDNRASNDVDVLSCVLLISIYEQLNCLRFNFISFKNIYFKITQGFIRLLWTDSLFEFDIVTVLLCKDDLLRNPDFHPSSLPHLILMGICVPTTISSVKYTLHAQSIFAAITIMQLSHKGNCVQFLP